MSFCTHKNLVLVIDKKGRLRCNDCHLTISEEELENGFCPECYEVRGVKNRNFSKVEEKETTHVRYRCEKCGILIECK